LTGIDVDGDGLSFQVLSQPASGSLTGSAPNLTYTPDIDFFGSDSFTFRTNDGSLNSAPATVTIDVSNVNDPPVANSQSISTNEDVTKFIALTASDVDGDTLTYHLTSQPSHGILTGGFASWNYIPSQNYSGSDSFTFEVDDGAQTSNEATISITVNPVEDPPTAIPDALTLNEDSPAQVSMFALDPEGQPLTYSIVSPPSHGSLSGSGSIRTYTPDADYFGSDGFTFKVNDGNFDSNVATFELDITAVNDAPEPAGDSISVARGETTSLLSGGATSLIANDFDVEGDDLTLSGIPTTQPQHGTVILNSDGTFSYVHNNSLSTYDSFEYEVCDDGTPSECASAWVSVYIDLSNSPECSAPLASIPDNDVGGIGDTITLSGTETIADIDVFLRISHDFVGHLNAVVSHEGVDVVLLDRPGYPDSASGCDGLDVETRLRDEAQSPAEDACSTTPPAIAGQLLPVGTLADFNDLNISGDWTLTVSDLEAGATGIFEQWCVLPNFVGNTAPVADPQSQTTVEDVSKLITLTGSDIDGDYLEFTIETPPAASSIPPPPISSVRTALPSASTMDCWIRPSRRSASP
jgi:subtilisin-like proprotein convertase family protein